MPGGTTRAYPQIIYTEPLPDNYSKIQACMGKPYTLLGNFKPCDQLIRHKQNICQVPFSFNDIVACQAHPMYAFCTQFLSIFNCHIEVLKGLSHVFHTYLGLIHLLG